ncbi:uncharacterized protein Z518_06918 [Rhinocladiella mackenziei CBS 650.93]|uniref:Exonuclease V, mitochondrial n=1 Tax=Rhinocladiella mackenziei CBS 650.93 TaxID=1442369 RepID=A0A0D2IJD4_9EURO|nr:uncharacterized protein Z518_06918 [Rhinocladiella mackenziei CBS 650.93]KIX03366.1 hypothetical protein Z518_06918 [Rhinocladiella mackenziei CBS 650.93]
MVMSNILDQPPNQETHMQVDTIESKRAQENEDEYSDFAEDPEELKIIDRLLLEAAAKGQHAALVVTDIEDYEAPRGVRLPQVPGLAATRQWVDQPQSSESHGNQNVRDQSAEARRTNGNGNDLKTECEETPAAVERDAPSSEPDTRSPLERFRQPPKKPLSVTDLISPAWCELQYLYVLSKHGRKRRTPAMKQGSAIHQALEDEVHVTVPVAITKKEDIWGLRIWNIIQGLRTLRETGRTRELGIWGSIGGELVNGVIDELSYDCPDPKLEEQSLKLLFQPESEPPLPEYQASIRDYLVTSETKEVGQSIEDVLGNNHFKASASRGSKGPKDDRRIYITDVKTRGTSTLPSGSSIRPTIVQLHLYHHMLENLAQGNFSLAQLATRYDFNVQETFSDAFIVQIGSLNREAFELTTSQQSEPVDGVIENEDIVPSTQDSMDILLQHNNLASLWEFMLEQFRVTFKVPSVSGSILNPNSNPDSQNADIPSSTPKSLSQLSTPPSFPTRLSPLLTARYISTNYTTRSDSDQSHILGSKSVIFNPSFLKSYLYDALALWRGEREPKGVEAHDAWKCRVCEFRDTCSWVLERDELAVRQAEERRKNRETNGENQGAGKRSRV